MRPGRMQRWRPLGRRLCAGLVLVSYLTTSIGVPLPAAVAKDRSRPFPCQDHPCGCQTAEACWRHCCCFTPEQKLAWARAHHVEPPPYAEKPAAGGWHTVRLRDQAGGAETRTCCGSCAEREALGRSTPARTRACCADRQASQPTGRRAPSGAARRTGLGWGLSVAALRCQGASTLWVNTQAVAPAPPPPSWSPDLAACGRLFPTNTLAHGLSSIPPDPPPRSLELSSKA